MNSDLLQTQTLTLPKQGILFSVDKNLFAIDLSIIKEVILPETRFAQLPMTPPFVKGLIESRNNVYPVIRLSPIESTEVKEGNRLILVEKDDHLLALYVDELHNIIPFTEDFSTQTHIPSELKDMVDLCVETPFGTAFYLDFGTFYSKLRFQANQLDLA